MKLDPTVMRTMNRQDYRVLAAVETGMRSHALVPSPLIASIASLRHGGTHKIISSLLRDKLLSHNRSCGYDGYRLTNSGYDILALHTLKSRGIIAALGDRIGTGKESDVYLAANSEGKQIVLKFHRLGRTSFRDVKKKRDYFMVNAVSKNKKHGTMYKTQPNSWLFLSRMSALKEFAFMKALNGADYPTPSPIAHNRHIVAMGLVRGVPLYQLHSNRVSEAQAESIFEQSINIASRLVRQGLVHCDLNEFNLMVDLSGVQSVIAGDDDVGEHYVRHSGMSVVTKGALSAHGPLQKFSVDGTGEIVTEAPPEPAELLGNGEPKPVVTLIDFPQMVSTNHPNSQELFERDIECLRRFFVKKLKCIPEGGWEELVPSWKELRPSDLVAGDASGSGEAEAADASGEEFCLASKAQVRLDEELKASGYSAEDSNRDMELHYYTVSAAHGIEIGSGIKEDGVEADLDFEERSDSVDDDDLLASPHDGSDLSDEEDDYEKDEAVSVSPSIMDASAVTRQTWVEAEQKAKARVQKHLNDAKRKGRVGKGAFKSKNSNKSYEKGKRVYSDHF
jgi:RIO kinase 2